MQTFLFAVLFLIVIGYVLMMRRLKQNVAELDDAPFNLSVASYKPNLKPGKYQVVITAIGADPESTLATVNRFRSEPLSELVVGLVVASNLDVYSCEDLIFELKYIGADGNVEEMEKNDN